MKMAGLSGDVRNPEWHWRWMSTSIQMSWRLLLPVCVMLTSVPDGNAFTCFASADSVRQENPMAWPSWTLRAPGREGTKCWYPSTRAMARDHRKLFVAETDGVDSNEQSNRQVEEHVNSRPLDPAEQDALFLEFLRWKELQKSVK